MYFLPVRLHQVVDSHNKENHPSEDYDNIPDYDNLHSDSDEEIHYRDDNFESESGLGNI